MEDSAFRQQKAVDGPGVRRQIGATVYPRQLYRFLSRVTKGRTLAVDVATGIGSAALPLAAMFDQVIAVDKQLRLLRCAPAHPRLQYVAATAERLPLPGGRTDLLTVAQALHHLDLPRFYMEAGRVLRRGGIIAAWCFGVHQLARNIDCYYHSIYQALESYWPPERQLVVSGYSGLPFPFERIASPQLTVSVLWRQDDFHVYLRSWTAFRRYVNEGNPDPLTHMPRDFWANSEERQPVSWPIHLLVGRAEVGAEPDPIGNEPRLG